jgi:hypothetical protein
MPNGGWANIAEGYNIQFNTHLNAQQINDRYKTILKQRKNIEDEKELQEYKIN